MSKRIFVSQASLNFGRNRYHRRLEADLDDSPCSDTGLGATARILTDPTQTRSEFSQVQILANPSPGEPLLRYGRASHKQLEYRDIIDLASEQTMPDGTNFCRYFDICKSCSKSPLDYCGSRVFLDKWGIDYLR